ncbi:MAG: hemerythrin domain-containing protein, partial [Bdellovibrionota bacterium]
MDSPPASLLILLRSQHGELLASLERFAGKPPGKREIASFGERLTEHFQLEEERYYPGLLNGSSSSRALAKVFQTTARPLSIAAREFVQKWTRNDPAGTPHAFRKDLEALTRDLSRRFKTEEERLYPFEAAEQKPAPEP